MTAREEAEHWFARLGAPDCTPAERQAFARWRGADAQNAAAYEQVERVFRISVDLLDDPALAAIRAEAHRAAPRRPIWRSPLAGLAMAASLAIAVGVGLLLARKVPVSTEHYVTAVGERRTVELADHSEVLLDTDSSVDVRFVRDERRVTLQRGRAQFSVAHDTQRPFVVEAGRGAVRALGTRFQILVAGGATTVLLLEGSVAVTAPAQVGQAALNETLKPGEELVFDTAGRSWNKRTADLDFARGWTQGDLVFNERPLGELLEEANRYATVQLRVGEPSLKDIRVSGVFHAGDQQGLAMALEYGWHLRANRTSGSEIVLFRRPE